MDERASSSFYYRTHPCAPAVCFPLSTCREGERQLAGVGVSQENKNRRMKDQSLLTPAHLQCASPSLLKREGGTLSIGVRGESKSKK